MDTLGSPRAQSNTAKVEVTGYKIANLPTQKNIGVSAEPRLLLIVRPVIDMRLEQSQKQCERNPEDDDQDRPVLVEPFGELVGSFHSGSSSVESLSGAGRLAVFS
jgi:hypothetical protein